MLWDTARRGGKLFGTFPFKCSWWSWSWLVITSTIIVPSCHRLALSVAPLARGTSWQPLSLSPRSCRQGYWLRLRRPPSPAATSGRRDYHILFTPCTHPWWGYALAFRAKVIALCASPYQWLLLISSLGYVGTVPGHSPSSCTCSWTLWSSNSEVLCLWHLAILSTPSPICPGRVHTHDSPVAHPIGLPPLPLADQALGGPRNLPAPQSAKLDWGPFLKMLLCWVGPTFRGELISTGDGSVPLLSYPVLAFRQGPSRSPGLSSHCPGVHPRMGVCMQPWFSPKWSPIASFSGPWLFHFLTPGVTSTPHRGRTSSYFLM